MGISLTKAIQSVYDERDDLRVIADIGRSGSSCSTAASLMGNSLDEITPSPKSYAAPERGRITLMLRKKLSKKASLVKHWKHCKRLV